MDLPAVDDSKLIIDVIPTDMVWAVWASCIPHIKKVVHESKGMVSMGVTLSKLASGVAVLVVVKDGADVVACNVVEPRVLGDGTRALYISITGGSRMSEWMDAADDAFHNIAKVLNCTELRGMSIRDGWMRVLKKRGWEEVYTEVRCKIEGKS